MAAATYHSPVVTILLGTSVNGQFPVRRAYAAAFFTHDSKIAWRFDPDFY